MTRMVSTSMAQTYSITPSLTPVSFTPFGTAPCRLSSVSLLLGQLIAMVSAKADGLSDIAAAGN